MQREIINGTGIAYKVERAAATDPWLVFSNSLITDHSIWDAQASVFGRRFNLLRYDQRGHGQSDIPDSPLNFDILGADLLVLMDAVGIRKATAVGLSMGVPTVFSAYDRAPDRFESLILMDGQAASAANAFETWQARIDTARANGMEAFGKATAGRWLTPDSHAGKLDRLANMIAATDISGFEACAGALQGYDYRHVLAACQVPVLALAGKCDGAMPETMERYSREMANAEFHAIDDAGHVPCYEQAAAVNDVIAAFLNKTGARS